jgi:hypothetical protein
MEAKFSLKNMEGDIEFEDRCRWEYDVSIISIKQCVKIQTLFIWPGIRTKDWLL